MLYFNSAVHDFWPVYNSIHRFYPVGIGHEIEAMYNSFPGTSERQKIIADNIYNDVNYKRNWLDFLEAIANYTGKKVTDNTGGITSCYSAYLQLYHTVSGDRTRTKGLHFFVSLLGPFYWVVGADENEVEAKDSFYRSTNFLVTSPMVEYAGDFEDICKHIEARFKGYRFIPFWFGKQIVDGLVLDYKDNNCSVFNALFNGAIDLNTNIVGSPSYKNSQWGDSDKAGKWVLA